MTCPPSGSPPPATAATSAPAPPACTPSPPAPGGRPAANTNVFARESHMDILAARAKVDPLAFRLRHLSDPRVIRVLESAAEQVRLGGRGRPVRARGGGRLRFLARHHRRRHGRGGGGAEHRAGQGEAGGPGPGHGPGHQPRRRPPADGGGGHHGPGLRPQRRPSGSRTAGSWTRTSTPTRSPGSPGCRPSRRCWSPTRTCRPRAAANLPSSAWARSSPTPSTTPWGRGCSSCP